MVTKSEHAPSYEEFARHHHGKGIIQLLRGLRVAEPVNLTAAFPHITEIRQVSMQRSMVQKETGWRISSRTFGGEVWVCRLKPENTGEAAS